MAYTPEQLPSGRWRGAVPVYDNGRRRRITKTFDYRFEAEQFVRETERRLVGAAAAAAYATDTPAPEVAPAPVTARQYGMPTLAAHADDWLRRRSPSITAGTANNYTRAVVALRGSRLGKARLDMIRRSDIENWVRDMEDDAATVSAVRLRIKVARMIFRDAIEDELIFRDPTAAIRLPTATIAAERTISRTEESRILLAADARTVAFCLLALDAGLRWGEAAGLAVTDVDIQRHRLTVRQVVERESGQLRGFPKSHRARAVPMGTQRLVDVLRPLHEQALAARGASGLLFATSRTGCQLGYDNWRRDSWYPARAAAGLADPQPRFHDLRHTYGTRLADAGVPRKEIAKLMGHADERTTGRYLHATDDETRAKLVRAAIG